MGINCCSYAKEPTDITIAKPEKNMELTDQNSLNQNNKIEVQNIPKQIQDLKQSVGYSNSNIIVSSDINTSNNSDINQNNISPLTQKEIDDILNKINYDYQLQGQQKEIINEENNIINIVTPNESIIKQNENIIIENNNLDIEQLLKLQTQNNINNIIIPKQDQNIVMQPNLNQNVLKENNNNNNNTNLQNNQIKNDIQKQNQNVYLQPNQTIYQNIQNQNQKIITQNIPTQNQTAYIQNIQNTPIPNQNKGINLEQKIPNMQSIQNMQNITNELNPQKTKIEVEYKKYFSFQQNEPINNAQNLNIEEILNNQNNQQNNQKINDNNQYIEDLLKNTSSNQNVNTNNNNNINLDVFFGQGDDIKIDDALIDKLFESTGKQTIQSQVQKQNINPNNQAPLIMSFNQNQNL